MKNTNICVVGGGGFLGLEIVKECLKRKANVFILDKINPNIENLNDVQWSYCDITDKVSVEKCIEKICPVQIYLLAGVLGTGELNYTPSLATNVNVTGVANFMDLFLKGYNFQIFFPSKPNVWNNLYSITKNAAENIVKYYMEEFELKGAIHRWFNIYGPGQHYLPIRKVVPHFILSALYNKPLQVWGSGDQTMDLIFSKDVAKITVMSMNDWSLTNSNVIEIGTGIQTSVNLLANIIVDLTNSKSSIQYSNMRIGESPNTFLQANVDHSLINYNFTDLVSGLNSSIEYYKSIPKKEIEGFFDFYHLS